MYQYDMLKHSHIVSVVGLISVFVISINCDNMTVGYFRYIPPKQTRQDLFCPDHCKDNHYLSLLNRIPKTIPCCNCEAVPRWTVENRRTEPLFVEYLNIQGYSEIRTQSSFSNISTIYSLIHIGGYITEVRNMCDFNTTVKIDLSRNRIKTLADIPIICLHKLDLLNFSGNHISWVSNDSFAGLSSLRVLDLSHNRITNIEKGTINDLSNGLLIMDFAFNKLESINASNMMTLRSFCKLDYSDNVIDKIENNFNYSLQLTSKYGEGGFLNIKNNKFTRFVNFTAVGMDDATLVGKALGFTFDFEGIQWRCDCLLYKLLKYSDQVQRIVGERTEFKTMKCASPSDLKGISLLELAKGKNIDKLICNITKDCPMRKCHCFYQPSRNRTVVNCINVGMKRFPKAIPWTNGKYFLNFANNSLTSLNVSNIGDKIEKIDISNNNIRDLDFTLLLHFNASVTLHENPLSGKLPVTLKLRNPCNVHLGTITVDCDCGSTWLSEWLAIGRRGQCNESQVNNITCKTTAGQLPAIKFDGNFLDCDAVDHTTTILGSIFGSLAFILGVTVSVVYHFRYGIYILKKSYTSKMSRTLYQYDVYILATDTSSDLCQYMLNILLPFLETNRYMVYWSCRDSIAGNFIEEDIITNTANSHCFLVILTEDFFQSACSLEWRYAWVNFAKDKDSKVIVVNYDHVRTQDCKDEKMRTFLRFGKTLSFENRQNELLNNIVQHIGIPRNKMRHQKKTILDGINVKFNTRIENDITLIDLQ